MADEHGPVTFNSRSKSPNNTFSNFYEAEIKMPEGVFGSVEHYFQAMKFADTNHSRFEINGDLGKRKSDKDSWKESVSRGRFIKSAGGKAGTQRYKLTLRRDGLDRERARKKMKEGLRAKFESEPFRSLLLKTEQRVLVHTPMRGKTDYWTGRVDKKDGNITGENNMGKLLMEVRQELQEESSRSEENFVAIEKRDEKESINESENKETVMNENKSDVDIKGESKGDDDIKDENIKDEIKGDDDSQKKVNESTSGTPPQKRKHVDNDVQQMPEGSKVKRQKIKEKSKKDSKNKDSSEKMTKNKDEKYGVHVKGGDTSGGAGDSSGYRGKKRKHEGDDVQVKDYDEEQLESSPKTKRKKIESKGSDEK